MNTAEKLHQSRNDDDATVDDLMDALSQPSETQSDLRQKGYTHELIETFQDEGTEDLVAPEVLFPDGFKHLV